MKLLRRWVAKGTDRRQPRPQAHFDAERQNLTMRMQMRRFTRLTNAFSKKFENHMHIVALYTVWCNVRLAGAGRHLLELDGIDMRREPIEVRKATLASILPQDLRIPTKSPGYNGIMAPGIPE